MEESSNKYALAALRERRAEIAGEITTIESRLRYLRQTIEHLDASLRLFQPGFDPKSIKSKKPYKRVKLFGAGKLNRMILAALRRGERPMSLSEIVDSIVAELRYGPDAAKGMRNRVRAALLYLTKVAGALDKTGERDTAAWALKPPPSLFDDAANTP